MKNTDRVLTSAITFATMLFLGMGPTTAFAMGSISSASLSLSRTYQTFIELDSLGNDRITTHGHQRIEGEVYARLIGHDGTYESRANLPWGQSHAVELTAFTADGDVLFEGSVPL